MLQEEIEKENGLSFNLKGIKREPKNLETLKFKKVAVYVQKMYEQKRIVLFSYLKRMLIKTF